MSNLLVQKRPVKEPASPIEWSTNPICERIGECAAATPDRAAIVHGSQVLSWANLDVQSDNLAACLRQRGVEQGSCIALLLERSPSFVVAALAVLKTGAAYLPLDCTTPPERLDYILTDSGDAARADRRKSVAAVPAPTLSGVGRSRPARRAAPPVAAAPPETAPE